MYTTALPSADSSMDRCRAGKDSREMSWESPLSSRRSRPVCSFSKVSFFV